MNPERRFTDRLAQLAGRTIDSGLVVGMKAETESEGMDWQSIAYLRVFAAKLNLPFHLKIGGCEAITDLAFARYLDVDHVVSPMTESSFFVEKLGQAVVKAGLQEVGIKVLVETETGIRNLSSILEQGQGLVAGVNFGRSDLLASIRHSRIEPQGFESESFLKLLEGAVLEARQHQQVTTIGGGVMPKTLEFLFESNPSARPDFIETRRFVLNAEILAKDPSLLSAVLKVERELIDELLKISAFRTRSLATYKAELDERVAETGVEDCGPLLA